MELFVFLFTIFTAIYCDVRIKKGELELEPNLPTLPFTPIARELIGSDIYIHAEFPSDVIIICGLDSPPSGLVEYTWKVLGSNYSSNRLDEIELRQISTDVVVTCSVADSDTKDEATSLIVSVSNIELPDRPSLPIFKLITADETRFVTERILVAEGSDIIVSCVSYSGMASHRVPLIARGDGLSLSNRVKIDRESGETTMSITDITGRESGNYVCSVDDLNIVDSVSGNKLTSCIVIEVVSCPTFPTFTIQSRQSVQFGFALTILCSSTTQSATPPHVSISHSNANESVARGYSGVVEYHIQALSHETAVEYECVASNECGSRSTSIKIELCPQLSTLQNCVSPCPKDCATNETERFDCLISAARTCTPGCECVAGHSLSNGKCVPDYDCPDGYPEVMITGTETRISFNSLDLCEADVPYSLLCEVRPVDRTEVSFYKRGGELSRDQLISVAENGSLILTGEGTRLGHGGIYVCEGNMSGRISQSSLKLNVIPSILDVKLTTEFSHLPNTSHGLNSLLYCRVMNAVSTSFRYNWYRNNVRILGAYLPVYRHMSANGMQNTNYSCQVSHNCGSNSEINTSIVVVSESLWHWIEPLDTSVYVNDTIRLTCSTDNPEVQLEWGDTVLGFDLSEDESVSVTKEIINGTETIILTILSADIDHSGTYLCSACVATECDIFPPTNRRVISTELEVLERGDPCVAGGSEYTNGDTFYVMDKASCLDMVLLVDLSTSMADAIHWLANVSALLENRLIEEAKEYRCQDRFGIATFAFNTDGKPRPLKLSNNNLFGTATMLRDDIEKFRYAGTIEDGYWGIETVIDKYDFRQEARRIIVILTDEERDKERKDLNFTTILNLLNTHGVTLYAIVEEQFEVKYKGELHRAMGLDEKGIAYIQDPENPKGYIKAPNGVPQIFSSYQTTHDDYVTLSHATGGASWDITLIQDNLNLYALALLDALFEDSIRRISCSNCTCVKGELVCESLAEFSDIPDCVAEEERITLHVSPTTADLEVLSSVTFTATVNIPGAIIRWYPTTTFDRTIQFEITRVNTTQYAITLRDVKEYYGYTPYTVTAQVGTRSVSVRIDITVRAVKLMIQPTYVSIYQGGDLSLAASINMSYPDVTWIWYYSPFTFHYTIMLSSRSSMYRDILQLDSDSESQLKLRGVSLSGYYIAVPIANQSSDVSFVPSYVTTGVELTAIGLIAWALKTETEDPKLLTVLTGSGGQFFAAEISLPVNGTFSWYHMNSSQLVEYTDGDTVAISNLGHISILSVHNVTRELQGVWVVSVEVGDGVRLTEELFLVVTQLSEVDLYIESADLGANKFPVLDQNLTLHCIGQGDPNPVCKLEKEGLVLVSDTSPISYTIDRMGISDIGMYSCVCYNSAGEKKDTFQLNIGCETDTSARPYHHGYAGRVCRSIQVPEEQLETQQVASCIVYFLDESRSMANEHEFIKNITTLIPILGDQSNTRFAVVGFGSARHAAGEIIPMDSSGRVFGTAFEAQSALKSIQTRGRREDGYLAMTTQLDEIDLTGCSSRQFLLLTDEDRDEVLVAGHPELTYDFVLSKLREHNIVLHVVVKEMYEGPENEPLFGMDYNRVGYGMASGDRVVGATWVIDSAHGNTNSEYTQLAFQLKGSAWDISKLRQFELRQEFASALVSQLRSTFHTLCEVCTCNQGNYSCFEVAANDTQHSSAPAPCNRMYLSDGTVFYQPSNPVIAHGDSLVILLLNSLHSSNADTYIVSSSANVELIDTSINIYNATQYENILITVNWDGSETEIVVFVVPCSIKHSANCTPEDVKREYFT